MVCGNNVGLAPAQVPTERNGGVIVRSLSRQVKAWLALALTLVLAVGLSGCNSMGSTALVLGDRTYTSGELSTAAQEANAWMLVINESNPGLTGITAINYLVAWEVNGKLIALGNPEAAPTEEVVVSPSKQALIDTFSEGVAEEQLQTVELLKSLPLSQAGAEVLVAYLLWDNGGVPFAAADVADYYGLSQAQVAEVASSVEVNPRLGTWVPERAAFDNGASGATGLVSGYVPNYPWATQPPATEDATILSQGELQPGQ
jgi:hypothetical protein